MFVSLFQQRPVAPEGNLIKGEWLKIYHSPPRPEHVPLLHRPRPGDFGRARRLYPAIVTIALDPAGDTYVVDVFRETNDHGQDHRRAPGSLPGFQTTVRGHRGRWPAQRCGAVPEVAHDRAQDICLRCDPAGEAQQRSPGTDLIGRVATKGLYLPPGAAWLSDFVAELISFPSSAHDDQVDACSVLFQQLANITPGRVQAPPKPPRY